MKSKGSSPARAGMLMAIAPSGGTPMSEVAAALDIAAPALSNLVERGVRDGLIERRADPDDGRAWTLVLTPTGKTMRAQAVEGARTLNARLVEGFTRDELAIVARWLESTAERLKEKDT
ncbi:MAG TPA: MarR family winged helix-turn-helix transcriptional regulator [Polyangiaceae bacterium]